MTIRKDRFNYNSPDEIEIKENQCFKCAKQIVGKAWECLGFKSKPAKFILDKEKCPEFEPKNEK